MATIMIIAAVVAFTVKNLASHPARIAVVIVAITGLVSALPPVLHSLRPPPVVLTPTAPDASPHPAAMA
ncbi:hypothetical protein [Streptomyces monomycini]|uniref:hypothetical protein n=1 Tax=Streptomyces monomycini TaxID=371720 RepID=UPI0012FEF95C|nr:hypothetical protein [Streptomyces monomycini]